MEIIHHRVNTLQELHELDSKFGAEVDVRSSLHGLMIHHDAFMLGDSLETWLADFHHGTLILNVKEAGLDESLLTLMDKYKISNFFFLDQDFPTTFRLAQAGEKRCAIRVSDYESIENAYRLAGEVDWIWLDTFQSFLFSRKEFLNLKAVGFKVCLVSPELHRTTEDQEIEIFFEKVHQEGIRPDAVCTKRPEIWEVLAN